MARERTATAARVVRLPQLGESVDSGTIVAWLVAEGDRIELDQPIAEVSTDKVDTEIPSPTAGTVTRLLVQVDDEVRVGEAILELDGPTDPEVAPDGPGRTSGRLSPRVRRLLADRGLTAAQVAGSGRDGRITPDDVLRAAAGTDDGHRRQRLSPLVRRLLREHGLDPAQVLGSGRDGRITPDDVRRAASGDASPPSQAGDGAADREPAAATRPAPPTPGTTPARAVPAGSPGDRARVEPLSRTRRVIAQRMLDSTRTTAQLTAAVEADVSALMLVRARLRDAAVARAGSAPSPLAFVARATCWALQRHPVINASIDTDAGTVTYHRPVHLGIAVDTPDGLVVPVIHDAHHLGVLGLQERIDDLADRARTRRLRPDDVTGGTFTITNTGSGGTLFDTPILNPPEAAILATPRIEKRPVVLTDDAGNDSIAIRHRTYLCLTYDHRLIDGADAARFLTDLASLLDTTDWEQELTELR